MSEVVKEENQIIDKKDMEKDYPILIVVKTEEDQKRIEEVLKEENREKIAIVKDATEEEIKEKLQVDALKPKYILYDMGFQDVNVNGKHYDIIASHAINMMKLRIEGDNGIQDFLEEIALHTKKTMITESTTSFLEDIKHVLPSSLHWKYHCLPLLKYSLLKDVLNVLPIYHSYFFVEETHTEKELILQSGNPEAIETILDYAIDIAKEKDIQLYVQEERMYTKVNSYTHQFIKQQDHPFLSICTKEKIALYPKAIHIQLPQDESQLKDLIQYLNSKVLSH